MRPPGLAEAADERRMRRFEENQRRVQPFQAPQQAVHLREVGQKALLAHVHHNRDARDAFTAHQFGQCGDERRGDVIDAEIPEIFERADGL